MKVLRLRKLKALLIGLSIVLTILLLNVPSINYGQGEISEYDEDVTTYYGS